MIPLRTSDSIDTSDTPWDFLSGDLLRDGRNLRLVMETVGELYGQIDPEERMRRAVDRAIHVTEAQRGFLLIDEDGVLRTRVARDARGRDLPLGDRYSRSIVQRVWTTGEPAKEAWEPGDTPIGLGQSIPSLQLESIMAMRLAYEGRPLGVLYIDATSTTKDFTHSEHKVFLALGGLVATALENGRLEAESVHQRCLARRVQLAREVQKRLLPCDIQAPEGYDIAGIGQVCHELSGDYYDVIPRPDGKVALVIGDVSGHNIASALHMVTTRALIRRLQGEGETPAKSLEVLNSVLAHDMQQSDFMSLFLGVLDPKEGSFTYASAGHNYPIVLRPPLAHQTSSHGRPAYRHELLKGTGPVLNVIPKFGYGTSEPIPLGAGDVVFLYTDGLTESRNAHMGVWGEDRLRASVESAVASGAPADRILDAVLADADRHRGPGPLDDDITALAVRVLP